jgi:lipopolysaccharide export system permease protein
MILIKYVIRHHIGPFFFSLFTLLFIFLLQFLMKYIDHIAGKGLSWFVIVEFVGLSLAWIIVLAVPMSVLVSTLMAFGGLSSTNEITAMKASGISMYRIIFPVMLVSSLLTYFLIWFNNDVLPDSNHKWATLSRDIQRKKPTLSLEPGIFNKDIDGYSILVRKTFENSNELEDMTIFDYSKPNKSTVITAQRGEISFSSDYEKIIINLKNGEIHETSIKNYKEYRIIKFKQHRISMSALQFGFKRSGEGAFSRSDREMSSQEMRVLVDTMKAENARIRNEMGIMAEKQVNALLRGVVIDSIIKSNDKSLNNYDHAIISFRTFYSEIFAKAARIMSNDKSSDSYLVEIYKKYSIPVACLIFVLLGAPLGMMTKKGGFGVGATLSLGFFLLYWSCLIGGEKLSDRDLVSPFIGMWIANIILGILGIYLVIKVVRESPGLSFEKLQKLIPKKYRTLNDPTADNN